MKQLLAVLFMIFFVGLMILGFVRGMESIEAEAKIMKHPDYIAAKVREAAGKCTP